MIHLTKIANAQSVYLSLSKDAEDMTVIYWKFTNRITKDVVTIYTNILQSVSTLRYTLTEVEDADVHFDGLDTGFWDYEVWAIDDIIVPTTEPNNKGFMYLHPAESFTPEKYNEQDNTFKTYQG